MESIQFPITAEKLYSALPHRPPMVWIDEVLWVNDSEGECRLTLKPNALYMDGEHLRGTSMIECVAQAFGYVEACRNALVGSQGLSKAFLVSIKDAQFADRQQLQSMQAGTSILILVKTLTKIANFSVIEGRVTAENDKILLGSAQLKVYGE